MSSQIHPLDSSIAVEGLTLNVSVLAVVTCGHTSVDEPVPLHHRRVALLSTTAKRMKIDQHCQRQHRKHVELEQFLACFRVARVCQR